MILTIYFQVGGGLKSMHQNLLAYNTDITINNVDDLVSVVGPHLSTHLNIFTKGQVEDLRSAMPMKLNTLTGAFQLHSLSFTSSGLVMAKTLPTEMIGREVKVNATFRQGMGNRTAAPTYTIHQAEE